MLSAEGFLQKWLSTKELLIWLNFKEMNSQVRKTELFIYKEK